MKKTVAIVLAIILLVTTFFAIEYTSKNCMHTGRNCCASCDVCAGLKMARQITTRIFHFASLIVISLLLFIFNDKVKKYDVLSSNKYTLVKQKVRLDN